MRKQNMNELDKLEDTLMGRIEEISDHCVILLGILKHDDDEDFDQERASEVEKDLRKILTALNTIRLE